MHVGFGDQMTSHMPTELWVPITNDRRNWRGRQLRRSKDWNVQVQTIVTGGDFWGGQRHQ